MHTYTEGQTTLKHNASVPAYWLYRGIKISRNLFSKRVLNVSNDMPAGTVDFTSLTNFKKFIMRVHIITHL